jgi:hypothetical protein
VHGCTLQGVYGLGRSEGMKCKNKVDGKCIICDNEECKVEGNDYWCCPDFEPVKE